MDCSPPRSSVHGIFQARILEWVAISFSRGSSQPRGRTWVSCTAGRFFTNWATREAKIHTKPQHRPQDRERSVFIAISKKGNAQEYSNYPTVALISQASKVRLKILQARLQQYVNWKLPNVQAGFRKGRGTRDPIESISWIIEKAREFQKSIYFSFIDYTKSTECVNHNKLWKILKEMTYQTTLPVSWETCMQVNKQQLEPDMKQWISSKLGQEYLKTIYCHPAYLTYMQSTSCKMRGCMKHKPESRLLGEISITSDTQMTPLLWQKVKKN